MTETTVNKKSEAVPSFLVFYMSYSRLQDGKKESWSQQNNRVIKGISESGNLNSFQIDLIRKMLAQKKCFPSGRKMWVSGTEWASKHENKPGLYNCTSLVVDDQEVFGHLMNLAMMGCGTGAVLELNNISKLPKVKCHLDISIKGDFGSVPESDRQQLTDVNLYRNKVQIKVGDSRIGWVRAYQRLIDLAFSETEDLDVEIDISNVRASGEVLKGFGGIANPVALPEMFFNVASVLNGAKGRKLNSVECCLLVDHAAAAVVAGNIRRSAGMRQFTPLDPDSYMVKNNLYTIDPDGNWIVDKKRANLAMANHTRVFHHYPSLDEVASSVQSQYETGEGALMLAPNALARCNFRSVKEQVSFLDTYRESKDLAYQQLWEISKDSREYEHRVSRYGLNPCGEIAGRDFYCNLAEVHLKMIDPHDFEDQEKAFEASALIICSLLGHDFEYERMDYSRKLDPIVGASFTGLFDFFVNAFGEKWLQWWTMGRGEWSERMDRDEFTSLRFYRTYQNMWNEEIIKREDFPHGTFTNVDEEITINYKYLFNVLEKGYLRHWRVTVQNKVKEFCEEAGYKVPNRCTTVQPSGSKSCLTGSSSGWHPPKSIRFLRRMTVAKEDPIALAAIKQGFSVIPCSKSFDDQGKLVNDLYSEYCNSWLIEAPVKVSWADLALSVGCDPSKFTAKAQLDFYMQVQTHYATHNTSGTIELREDEIQEFSEDLHERICDGQPYISSTLLARFDDFQTYPRLPFEPISEEEYKKRSEGLNTNMDDFYEVLCEYTLSEKHNVGPAQCDSDKCLM